MLKPFTVKVQYFLGKWWLISNKSPRLNFLRFMRIWYKSFRFLIHLLVQLLTIIVLQVILTFIVVWASISLYFSLVSMDSVTFTLKHSSPVFVVVLSWVFIHHSCLNSWILTSKPKLLKNLNFSLHFWRHHNISIVWLWIIKNGHLICLWFLNWIYQARVCEFTASRLLWTTHCLYLLFNQYFLFYWDQK